MKRIVSMLLCFSILTLVFCSCSPKEKLPDAINNPSSEYVINCLKKIPLILDIEAVTERNDPNGNLNKQGGYTAQVYFSYALVDQDEFDEKSVIDKGTDCGGSVEVYRTEKDAKKRDEYLSTFDGGPVASGSHTVVGTMVVRTSNLLTASQQRSLEYDIIAALKGEDDKISKENPYEEDFKLVERSADGTSLTPKDVENHFSEKKYTKAEINYIIENCGVNWKYQACRAIKAYANNNYGIRKSSVHSWTIGVGFNEEEYEYGMSNCGVNWGKEAVEFMENCMTIDTDTSRFDLYDFFEWEETGYTAQEIEYAVDNCGINWCHRAVVDAEELVSMLAVPENATVGGVATILADDDGGYRYTEEQARYGAENYSNDAVWFLCLWEYYNGKFSSEGEARQLLENYEYSSDVIETAIEIFCRYS